VFVPSFTGLGAPYWDADARGAIMGLSRGTTQAHIVRACLEAQGFQTQDLITAMRADTQLDIEKIRVDGGLVTNDFVCQHIANQIGATLDRPINTEATVWGVAAMAFYQSGEFTSFDDISDVYKIETSFAPLASNADDYNRWQRAVRSVRQMLH
jgi:glycerol kinase